MKKLLAVLFIFVALGVAVQAHAFTLDDLMLQIQSLKNEILQLKSSLKATALTPSVPILATPISHVTSSTASLEADMISLGIPASVTTNGFCYAPSLDALRNKSNPSRKCTQGWITPDFRSSLETHPMYSLSGLTPNTQYYFVAYAQNATGFGYSPEATFFTSDATSKTLPTVSSPSVFYLSSTQVNLSSKINTGIPDTIISRGFCYGTSTGQSKGSSISTCTNNTVQATGDADGNFNDISPDIKGLIPGTKYYYVAYAVNVTGTGYSTEESFTTPLTQSTSINGGWSAWVDSGSCVNSLKTQTRSCTNPAPANGGIPCSGSTSQPVSCNSSTPVNGGWSAWVDSGSCVNGSQTQTRTCTNPAPTPGGAYCVGNASQSVSCTATPTDSVPGVYYPSFTSVTSTSATLGANIMLAGYPTTISARGVCYGTRYTNLRLNTSGVTCTGVSATPNNILSTGAFTVPVTSLTPSTQYYLSGYATNQTGTGYSALSPFTTLATSATPINGGWSAWVDSTSCINGYKTQTHTCTNPAPANGGAYCVGVSTQQISCGNTNTSCLEQGGNICSSYEVCEGSILGAKDSNRCCSGKCALPSNFDWRNRHGENWNSPVKNQGNSALCTLFGGIAPIESAINLYYNQHLNVDLSEQSFMCDSGLYHPFSLDLELNPCVDINSPASTICDAKFSGILEESCYKDTGDNSACVNSCSNISNFIWKVTDFAQLITEDFRIRRVRDNNNNLVYDGPLIERLKQEPLTEENLKIKLITYGPVASAFVFPGHTASIVGWNSSGGQTSWIIKNSYGPSSGDQGYVSVIKDATEFGVVGVVKTPIVPPVGKNYSILCVDKDKDNFCNWGISEEKPSSCPSSCKNEKDWDDSNPNIGALGTQTENLSGTCFSIPFTQKLGIEWINTGIEVEKLQTLLHDDGFLPDCVVDGNFGINTKLTLMAFQTTYGLDVDGIVGPLTRAKLNERWQAKCLAGN